MLACSVAQEIASRSEKRALIILQKKIAGLNEEALQRFVVRARKAAGLRGTVNVLVTNSAAVRALNRQFRGKNKATDVLSFAAPTSESHATSRANSHATSRVTPKLAGDVAISADIAFENAIRLGHAVAQEIKILTLHGILHLAGFDHERDNGAMARKEAQLRSEFRLPLALIERTKPERSSARKRPDSKLRGRAKLGGSPA
jgi:probable rRNA maturation factor